MDQSVCLYTSYYGNFFIHRQLYKIWRSKTYLKILLYTPH